MTPNAKGFGWSIAIHALAIAAGVLISRSIDPPGPINRLHLTLLKTPLAEPAARKGNAPPSPAKPLKSIAQPRPVEPPPKSPPHPEVAPKKAPQKPKTLPVTRAQKPKPVPIRKPKPVPKPVAPRKAAPKTAIIPAAVPSQTPVPVSEPIIPAPKIPAEAAKDNAPAGKSGAAGSRTALTPPPQGKSFTAEEKYLSENYSYIRNRILKRLKYPRMARKMGWSGQVKITFMILEDGRVSDLAVLSTSGYKLLDKNALATVRKAAPFPPPPVAAQIVMPISYRMD